MYSGLPEVEFAPLVFAYYDIAPETVRIRNTGEAWTGLERTH